MLLRLLRLIPLGILSYLTGRIVALRLPRPLALIANRTFCRLYGVRTEEAASSIDEYRSLAELFTRDLKAGSRPQHEGVTSPVDGTLRDLGEINNGQIPQVKGWTYTLSALLQDQALAERFRNGSYLNFYLSPPDYHHVHLPLDAALTEMRYIPGTFWPVNDWALRTVPQLFCSNERVVMLFDTEAGMVALIMVGALNVSKISLTFDPFVSHDSPGHGEVVHHTYQAPLALKKGDRLGTFHLGSTVVILFERPGFASLRPTIASAAKVQVGQAILRTGPGGPVLAEMR